MFMFLLDRDTLDPAVATALFETGIWRLSKVLVVLVADFFNVRETPALEFSRVWEFEGLLALLTSIEELNFVKAEL